MATRMQQRRGTAAQWTAANPTLAAGEIGFETDTSKFKMGNGSSAWTALTYFANAAELAAILDSAPGALDTLNELAAAMGDDPAFFTTVATNLSNHQSDTTSIHGIADMTALATTTNVSTAVATEVSNRDTAIATHSNDTTSIHGIVDTANLALLTDLTTHNSDTTDVHGIVNTANLALLSDISTEVTNRDAAISAHNADTTDVHGIVNTANLALLSDVTGHQSDTTSIHGIVDTANLALLSDISTEVSNRNTAIGTHNSDTTDVHGIGNTALLALLSDVSAAVGTETTNRGTAISAHNSDTTDVHGIGNTALLALLSDVSTAVGTETTNRGTAISAHNSDTTDVHGIGDTSLLATKAYADSAVTSAEVNQSLLAGTGLDWNSGDERFDIDSTVATKTYADNAVSTHDTDTTNVHGIANTALLATTADVAAVTKTTLGLGSVDNTADTAKPVSTSQASAIATAKAEAIADATAQVTALVTGAPAAMNTLDELAAALGDDENFAASVTTSLGLKVDSLTPISQKTASYTLSSLTERDDLIEMGSGSALTLTIPTDATLDFPIGTSIDILQTGAGQVTVAPVSGTVTVNATPGLKLRTTWSSATLFKRAANTWVVFGDLTA